jgi:DNA-binding NarL/FixJ family response regulator
VDSAIKPLTAVPSSNHEEPAATVDDVEPLTGTERDVLRLMAKSWSNHRIAERLGMDADAIATARNSAMLKAGLLTRLQVLRYVRERGWLRTFDE